MNNGLELMIEKFTKKKVMNHRNNKAALRPLGRQS